MSDQRHSTAAAEILDVQTGNGETPDFLDLADSLQKAKELIDCIYLAGHGLGDRMKMNAIVRVASDAANVIERVRDHLENFTERNAGGALSELLAAYAGTVASINSHGGEPDHPEVVALCKQLNATILAICGYRPLTEDDERRKAEFLRERFRNDELNVEEQDALIASMLPEGGAA